MARAIILTFFASAALITLSCGGDSGGTLKEQAVARQTGTAAAGTKEASPTAEASAEASATTPGGASPATAPATATGAQPKPSEPPRTPEPATPAAATVSKNVCVVGVTGSQAATITDRARTGAASTDYWIYSPDRISRASEPIDTVLLITCSGRLGEGVVTVTLVPSPESKHRDVPFGPKTYTIAAGSLLDDPAAGEFSVVLSVGTTIYEVNAPGRLTVDAFNNVAVSGTFSFDATEASFDDDSALKKVHVEGTFEFPCAGSQCRK